MRVSTGWRKLSFITNFINWRLCAVWIEGTWRMRKYLQFVRERQLLSFKAEWIFTVEKLYQLFLFLLIDVPFRVTLGIFRNISILATAEVRILVIVWWVLLQLRQVDSQIKIVAGSWSWYFEMRWLVHIVLGITVINELLDTTHWRIGNVIKYLVLLLSRSLEVFIDHSILKLVGLFLDTTKIIVSYSLLALILLEYSSSKSRKTVIGKRIRVGFGCMTSNIIVL